MKLCKEKIYLLLVLCIFDMLVIAGCSYETENENKDKVGTTNHDNGNTILNEKAEVEIGSEVVLLINIENEEEFKALCKYT